MDAGDLNATIEAVGGFLAAEPTDAQVSEVAGVVLRAFPDASFANVRPVAPETGKTGDAGTVLAALLSAPSPNPSAGASEIAFALVDAGPVRLAVYDALGREVAVLADGDHEAGAHAASFDGRTVAPGVYLVRLSAGDASATTRLTVVR